MYGFALFLYDHDNL